MHGGNGRSGAPRGNRNAAKVGSAEALVRLIRKHGPPANDLSRLGLGSDGAPFQQDAPSSRVAWPPSNFELAALLASESAVSEVAAFLAALHSDGET